MRNIHFQVTNDDIKYLPLLKPILSGKANVSLHAAAPTAILEVVARAKEHGATSIATTSPKLLQLLLGKIGEKMPSVDDYAGSIIEKYGMEFLILNPVDHLITVPYGKHLYTRYFSKLLQPADWLVMPEFSWELAEVGRLDLYKDFFAGCNLISCDIETPKCETPEDPRGIVCVGFTGCIFGKDEYTTHTVVFPFTEEFIVCIRGICGTNVPKTFQNGKYDNGYLLMFGLPVRRWSLDTAHMFHSWQTELPKRLDFITSYTLRKWQYWKDESKSTDIMEYYAYNAKDCFGTLCATLSLLREMPQWALDNFKKEFPVVFPCLEVEMRGIACDVVAMARMNTQMQGTVDKYRTACQQMVGNKLFNPGSATQVRKLFEVLGSGDVTKTTPAGRNKVASRHPMNKRILDSVEKYRKDAKLLSTYLVKEKIWHGRIFFDINPHGSDTGRLASSESKFWTGLQIHNQPRDREDISIKEMYVTDPGFHFGEGDFEQAEARDTAYLSGDEGLIAAVDGRLDFHALNASAFFGIPYEKIVLTTTRMVKEFDEAGNFLRDVEETVHDVIDKVIRDLSKRVNHGANYNMGPAVLIDTMGIEKILKAQKLLNLPSNWSLKQVAEFLLDRYAKTYPGVKGDWYKYVIACVEGSRFLIGPTGWHRYCYGNPAKSKPALNSYVAHPPQSLNAMTLNKAYVRVHQEVALKNVGDFKLGPQIHDSILFQYKKGRLDLVRKVMECMKIPTPVTDCHGITRILTVPVGMKCGAERWSDIVALSSLTAATATKQTAQ